GLVLDDVSVQDDRVRLEFKKAGMIFEGKRNKERREIVGELKQAGQAFPLTLKKVAKVTEPKRPQVPQKPYPYGEREAAYGNKKACVKLAGTLTLPRSK